jgi:hypothetical protein
VVEKRSDRNINTHGGLKLHLKRTELFRKIELATRVLEPEIWTVVALGWTPEARKLLEAGAHIEAKGGKRESSPLHRSAYFGREVVSALLLARGAEVSAKDNAGIPRRYAPIHPPRSRRPQPTGN